MTFEALPDGALKRLDPLWYALAALLFVVAWRAGHSAVEPPAADALRYLDYALNLAEHDVFGLTPRRGEGAVPEPGRANTPLYPAFVAALIRPADLPALRCLATPAHTACDLGAVQRVVDVQLALAALSAVLVAVCALRLWGRRAGWFALGAVFLSGELTGYAYTLLTENLVLLFFALLTLTLCQLRHGRWPWALLQGVVLGALALTRPEFLYLGAAIAFAWILLCLRRQGRRGTVVKTMCFAVAFISVIAPWSLRNVEHFGDGALTSSYAGRILAQRTRYNHMSMRELGVAFVYWLPDFGDSWARRLFTPEAYARLGFGPGTYYSTGMQHHDEVAARAGGEQAVVVTLLREDVFAQPLKHALVSIALAWRAIFVAKLWGLVALLAFAYILWRRPGARKQLLMLSLPAWFMLGFYANVSVSIPRYAVSFVPVFALTMASLVDGFWTTNRDA